MGYPLILGIESSCDETAVAVVRGGREVLSNVISSQVPVHTIYGGVVPEIASRKHIEAIDYVVDEALKQAGVTKDEIDAVAVTYGPGLVGALLVGLSHAKALAFAWGKPLLGVNHMHGHIAANYLSTPGWEPPYLCLVVSGGHTHLVRVKSYKEFEVLGLTSDDAAGEAFDKVARAIGLGYPGGPKIQKKALEGNPQAIAFPRPRLAEDDFDFSFSGLKSAVLNYLNQEAMARRVPEEQIKDAAFLSEEERADIAASFQAAVVEVLSEKTRRALRKYGDKKLAVAGGVSANQALRAALQKVCQEEHVEFSVPELILCTDNAAMIAATAYYEYEVGESSPLDLNADPNLAM